MVLLSVNILLTVLNYFANCDNTTDALFLSLDTNITWPQISILDLDNNYSGPANVGLESETNVTEGSLFLFPKSAVRTNGVNGLPTDDTGSGNMFRETATQRLMPRFMLPGKGSSTPESDYGTTFRLPGLSFYTRSPASLWSMGDVLANDLTRFNSDDVMEKISKFSNELQNDIISVQLRYCPYTDLCTVSSLIDELPIIPNELITEGMTSDRFSSCCQNCSCDIKTCYRDQTCCPDIIEYPSIDQLNNVDSGDVMSMLGTVTKDGEVKRSCLSLKFGSFDYDGLYGVEVCPDPDNEYSHKCTRDYTSDIELIMDIVPCQSRTSFEVYRNRFCAYCNHVSDDDIDFFEPRLQCLNEPPMEQISDVKRMMHFLLAEYTECHIDFMFDPDAPHQTCRRTRNTCNVTGEWKSFSSEVEFACRSYKSEITYDTFLYQNMFCIICNGFYEDVYQSKCLEDLKHYSDGYTYSFSGLLKIETGKKKQDTAGEGKCSPNELYDDSKVNT